MNWRIGYLRSQGLRSIGRAIPFACVALCAQSVSLRADTRASYVEGTVRDSWNTAVAGVEVKFESDKSAQSVVYNSKGYYRAKLAAGVYAMSVSWRGDEKYRR